MRILFAASECAPFIKTGGLADVVGALPKALKAEGVSVRVLLPAYPALSGLAERGKQVMRVADRHFGSLRVMAVNSSGLDLLLVVAPKLYDRPGNPYLGPDGRDWPDNHLRYAALSKVAAMIARDGVGDWTPDVLHAHDWQAGLAPAFLRLGKPSPVRSVLTLHNIAFQGIFPETALTALGLPKRHFTIDGFEYHGSVSFLKAGVVWSDRITTVSPTYARELMTPEYGMGFEGILAERRGDLSGILNGIDTEVWNPETDAALAANYSSRAPSKRVANRKALIERFGLGIQADSPLFCVISRLTRQKGLDLLLQALPHLTSRGAGIVVLGSGDADIEAGYKAAAARNPENVGVEIGYDEQLSHLIQGGADCIVIPSRFEPCGLTQLYGLRYGCIPLVARTGGLADTVIDANDAAIAADVATGFQFFPVSAEALTGAIDRVCDRFANQSAWRAMMRRAMRHPVGWERSAAAYRGLYEDICRAHPCEAEPR